MYKKDFIQLLNELENIPSDVRAELKKVTSLLKRKDFNIEENGKGRMEMTYFLDMLFSKNPQMINLVNYKLLFHFFQNSGYTLDTHSSYRPSRHD